MDATDTSLSEKNIEQIIKSNLTIICSLCPTTIVVVGSHKDGDVNDLIPISCNRCIPIKGYPYDVEKDCYYVRCLDYLRLGEIPISYEIEVEGANWKTRFPLPDQLIENHLDQRQKCDLDIFKQKFQPYEEYNFEYLQMVNLNYQNS